MQKKANLYADDILLYIENAVLLTLIFLKLFLKNKWKVSCTHSLGIKVLFDCESVHHTRAQALLHTGQEKHHQPKDLEVHSESSQERNLVKSGGFHFLNPPLACPPKKEK